MSFKPLDPILHNQLRLAIISILISVEEAEFSYLLSKTEATKGNLSAQLKKLGEAEYIEIKKSFRNNYPLTTCRITHKGIVSFKQYVSAIKTYLDSDKP